MGKEFFDDQRKDDRRDIGAWGRYRTGRGVARDVQILDVNMFGCRFRDKFGNLVPDNHITMKIGNIGPILTHIRWRDGAIVGTEFEEPLYGAVLDHITRYFDERTAEEKARIAEARAADADDF
ncbi:hypothetical protein GRI48_07255 [Altererythrobacter oceanensis]|uniref:PilZ domain-containing protein n=2 Tax=Qipengyuania oceanensis TaxID=1463597 RepID=A0A844YF67_9SPHN|nr:hypothetical protein [Qipengyuania oceanensis]